MIVSRCTPVILSIDLIETPSTREAMIDSWVRTSNLFMAPP